MNKVLNELTIEITQKCLNSCLYCSSLSSKAAKNQIEKDHVLEVGRQAYDLGLRNICLSGGEPLLHPEFFEIVSELNNIGLKATIYTTGIAFGDDEYAFTDWGLLAKDGVRLIFGVHSSDAEVHDFISRNKGSYRKTKQALLAALDKGYDVEVHVVPNRINISTIESTTKDLISLGVEKVSFLRLVMQGFARSHKSNLQLTEKEVRDLKLVFDRLSDEFGGDGKIRLGIPFSNLVGASKVCNAGISKLIIRYDGKVLPCEAFKDEEFDDYVLGDIKSDNLNALIVKAAESTSLITLKAMTGPCETCPAQLLYNL